NERPFKQLPGNRREAFEQLDRPALGSLPVHPYRYVAIKTVKVNIDYHVSYEQHHYSVPHQYVGQQLELHAGDTLLQVYHQQQLVASHPRKTIPGMSTL
ncbi:IS21 family transposase, partial [Aeromonas sp. Prich7-2]|nr:IS21 family transposase [Aeromonas sp. Prich7-2]MBP4061119.1 IS21 family transposase [Aeromonas sp. Prich7-2]